MGNCPSMSAPTVFSGEFQCEMNSEPNEPEDTDDDSDNVDETDNKEKEENNGTPLGILVGSAAGGAALIGTLAYYIWKRNKKEKKDKVNPGEDLH